MTGRIGILTLVTENLSSCSEIYALHGYEPPAIPLYEPHSSAIESLDKELQGRGKVLQILKQHPAVA
ncbi:hypothetical protein ACLOJK_022430 [Asimina triloba]